MVRRARGGAWVLAKYLVLQLPGWLVAGLLLAGLVRWTTLGPGVATLLFALWVAKDFALYPILRIAYEPGEDGPEDRLIGARAVARDALAPGGYVRLGAELWRAELRDVGPEVPAGASLRVVGLRGLTLLVEPEPPSPDERAAAD